ncbi:MAG: hypothetical protein ACRCT8_13685 [Lacipirellulaceae bacterium]
MNEEQAKQLLRELGRIRACAFFVALVLVLEALNRVFCWVPY